MRWLDLHLPPGPYTNGEIEMMRALAEEAPLAFTFTRHSPTHTNLDAHGHVAAQVLVYRLKRMRAAARRLEETWARAAVRPPQDAQQDTISGGTKGV